MQHSDYHSSHRVRPDSQILLSTILHHLLLEGEKERERETEREERVGRGAVCRISGMIGERGEENRNGEMRERRVNEG